MIPKTPDYVPDWVAGDAWTSSAPDEPPDGMAELWPDEVLAEAEWERGWFERSLIAGAVDESARAVTPRRYGGDAS